MYCSGPWNTTARRRVGVARDARERISDCGEIAAGLREQYLAAGLVFDGLQRSVEVGESQSAAAAVVDEGGAIGRRRDGQNVAVAVRDLLQSSRRGEGVDQFAGRIEQAIAPGRIGDQLIRNFSDRASCHALPLRLRRIETMREELDDRGRPAETESRTSKLCIQLRPSPPPVPCETPREECAGEAEWERAAQRKIAGFFGNFAVR